MSYSDYGGYCWKNQERFTDGEDGTLIGITAPKERPIEQATGLKLDVLVNAYAKQGANYGDERSHDTIDYLTGHPHHAVVGGMVGMGIVGHKQTAYVMWDGKKIKELPEYHEKTGELKESQANGEKEGYMYWLKAAIEKPFEITGGVVFKLITPDRIEYTGVSGYGIGPHPWKEDDGRQFLYPGDRLEPDGSRYWSSEAYEEDKKKYNLTDDDEYKVIGYVPDAHWPTYEEWEKYVREWAINCK